MVVLLKKGKSKIHGFGVFAQENISKGKSFYKIPLNKVYTKPKKRCAYIGNAKWVYDNDVLNWINHSCDANTKLDLSKKNPVLVAIKNIKKGEEVTCNYNKTEKGGKKVPCNCGSANCKGYFLRKE